MLDATFYIMLKRNNSTKQPTDALTHLALSISINDPNTSLTNPVIRVSSSVSMLLYNYVYISQFGRYYHIENWQYNADGTWSAYTTEDYLASWKTAIQNSGGYVERSYSQSDASIVDTLYPAKNYPASCEAVGTTGLSELPYSGCFVIGIIENRVPTTGAVSYYLVTYDDMQTLLVNMLTAEEPTWSLVATMTPDVLKSFIDPLQYIVSCKWLPISISNAKISAVTANANKTEINLRGWNSGAQGYKLLRTDLAYPLWTVTPGTPIVLNTTWNTINLGDLNKFYNTLDGEAVDLAYYPKVEPYASYTFISPWGVFELDSSIISQMFAQATDANGYIHIKYRFSIDLVTGSATLIVAGDLGNNIPYYEFLRTEVAFARDVPLAQTTYDYEGFNKAGNSAVFGALSSGMQMDVLGAAEKLINATWDVSRARRAPVSQSNVSGISAFTGEIERVRVQMVRYKTVGQSSALFGKPLQKYVASLAGFSGFVQVSDSTLAAGCLDSERDTIVSYLREGVYIE